MPLQLTYRDNDNEPPSNPYDARILDSFSQLHPVLAFVYIQWLDYMATMRMRIIPIQEFKRIVAKGERIGISRGNTGTLQNDAVTPAVHTTGVIYVEPDLKTLRPTHSKDPLASATVIASFRDEKGRPLPACPRSNLETLSERFQQDYGIEFLVGFEIEVTFLRRTDSKSQPYEPLDTNHAWGTLTPEQWLTSLPVLAEIVTALQNIGISVQQLHSESGAGQYEFVLPPLPPTQAVDNLIQARQVVHQIAVTHGLRATLHPKPFEGIGTAAHAHVSLNSSNLSMEELEKKEMAFFASVIQHLPSLCAFMLPEGVSYTRVAEDSWTSGVWVAWGTQNREVPLRRVKQGRWELRCLDGMANMYLALGALLGAGLVGVQEGLEMGMKDCESTSLPCTLNIRLCYANRRRRKSEPSVRRGTTGVWYCQEATYDA